MVSCFTAGTQIVTDEKIIESAGGTEIIVGQSFDESNVFFVGLGLGITVVFLSSLRKERRRNELQNKQKFQEDQDMNAFDKMSGTEADISNTKLKTISTFSWRKWFLLPFLFVSIILCGYFALPTIESVAVPSGATQIEKRYVTKNIEDIQVGDYVYAFDVETSETVKRRIVIDFNSGRAWYTNNHYDSFKEM